MTGVTSSQPLTKAPTAPRLADRKNTVTTARRHAESIQARLRPVPRRIPSRERQPAIRITADASAPEGPLDCLAASRPFRLPRMSPDVLDRAFHPPSELALGAEPRA